MLNELENFYFNQPEPNQSCFIFLRDLILSMDKNITSTWKYKLPFFEYKGKMFCYLWMDKRTKHPYIGIAKGNELEHPLLYKGDRKKIKILMIDPNTDIPINAIKEVLNMAVKLY